MLLDLEMPKLSGLEVMQRLAAQKGLSTGDAHPASLLNDGLPIVIVLTAFGTIDRAVEAMKLGAFDFLTKPFESEHLSLVIQKAVRHGAMKRHMRSLQEDVDCRYELLVGRSARMHALLEAARKAAESSATVLLTGETGTGKEILARSIHRWSLRAEKPFVVVNCAALPETLLENELFGHEKGAFTGAERREVGKIESADGGTVFLDEIGDTPPALQARLLRVLQDREIHRLGGAKAVRVDVRFVPATNKDLARLVKAGTFREDLFYRLNVVALALPPLRERIEDLPDLAEFFLEKAAATGRIDAFTFTPAAMSDMMSYAWPGNIRELRNAIERATILCRERTIEPKDLGLPSHQIGTAPAPPAEHAHLHYHDAMEHTSRRLLLDALRRSSWNQTKAADALGLQRTYLTKLLRQKGISGRPPASSESACAD
jgi:DNA-binding NtrC family response regulator